MPLMYETYSNAIRIVLITKQRNKSMAIEKTYESYSCFLKDYYN